MIVLNALERQNERRVQCAASWMCASRPIRNQLLCDGLAVQRPNNYHGTAADNASSRADIGSNVCRSGPRESAVRIERQRAYESTGRNDRRRAPQIGHCTKNALKRRLPAHELDLARVELPVVVLQQEEVLALHDEESQHVSSSRQNLRVALCAKQPRVILGHGPWLTEQQPGATFVGPLSATSIRCAAWAASE